jgi:predicted ArsR family transcriptional regulator
MESFDPAQGGTRGRILTLLLHAPAPLSVAFLATQLGISRNATHQHVGALERDGLVERSAQLSTGGRPSQGFRLSPTGEALFPRQYSLLARKLIGELATLVGPDVLPQALARIGRDIAAEVSQRLGGREPNAEAIAALMRELGYEAHLANSPARDEIEAHNCVFHDLAMRDPGVCAVDLALLEALSGRAVEHRTCMAKGDRSCRFALREAGKHGRT